jgi:MFS family permease
VQQNLQGNIWKYTLILIANKRVFVAIIGAYYLTIPGVTTQTIGALLLLGNVVSFLLEIPSGYISDKIGHRQALILSRALMALSSFVFLCTDNRVLLIVAVILWSASGAFQSGTGSAFMHETLRGLGREHEYTSVMGRVASVGFAVPIVFMVFVPFLVGISYKLPFVVSLVMDLLGFVAALSLTAPAVPMEHIEEVNSTNFWQVLRDGHRLNFFIFALFSSIISGVLFSFGGFRAPYQLSLHLPVIWFGVLFGIGRAGASLMLAYSGWIQKRLNIFSFYAFEIGLYFVLFLILGVTAIPWIVALVFIVSNAFNWGLSRIDEGYQMNIIQRSKFKATLLSVAAQIDAIFGGIAGFGLGFAIKHLSYQYAFLCFAFVFLIILLPVYAYIIKRYGKDPRFAL